MNSEGHLTSEETAAYWRRTLAPETLLELSEHLQGCASCREKLSRARPASARAGDVSYDELIAWMDGTLDPIARRALGERIANSPQASLALADLLRFRGEMEELPEHNFSAGDAVVPNRTRWILPLAAGLTLGLAFLWLTSIQQNRRGLALHDGGQQIVVRQNGAVPALGTLPPDLQEAVRAAARGKVSLPATLDRLRGEGETLAGHPAPPSGLAVIAPVGTMVETPRPILRWSRQKDATGYRVNLASPGGQVISSPVLAAETNEWTPATALAPNETYEWEVEALRDGEMIAKAPAPPEPEARFAVLPDDKRGELETQRATFGRSHLVMGLAYAKAGLLPQARAEFAQLAAENPGSELPRKLLAELEPAR